MYSLNTDEDLTHYGQSLSSLEKFEEPDLASDDEEGGMIDSKYTFQTIEVCWAIRRHSDRKGLLKRWKYTRSQCINTFHFEISTHFLPKMI